MNTLGTMFLAVQDIAIVDITYGITAPVDIANNTNGNLTVTQPYRTFEADTPIASQPSLNWTDVPNPDLTPEDYAFLQIVIINEAADQYLILGLQLEIDTANPIPAGSLNGDFSTYTIVDSLGDDLSVTDAQIVSAAGGTYTVIFQGQMGID